MLNLNEVAQWLTNTFNEIGSAHEPKYTFNIYAEVGEDKNNADIQGVYKVDIPKNVPVNKIVNVRYYGDIDLTVSAPRSNYNLANVEEIVGKVAKQINGTEKVFANGKGYITMSVTGTGNFKTEYSQGNIVPLKIKLDINYSENVVTGGGKHWYIAELIGDYIEIPYITERVTVEKDGKVSPIYDRAYKQAFMLAQQRSYMFTLPYDDSVGAMLTKDILTGDANKNYRLKYVDGVAFTEEEPFETQVVLYRNGDNGETKPDSSILNIIFTDADSGDNETKYSLALIDNEFDGATENTRWFDSITEQQEWFATRIANGANYDSIDAPNLNNLVLTNQIYKNTRNYDIFDLVNKNYAVIKVNKGDNTPQYYYYKVANADIGANGQVIYTLQLDSIQTWLFRDNLIIDDSFINKAHLDRWIENSDGTISFNGKADSKLFEREEIRNVATRLVARQKLKLFTVAGNEVNDWLNKKIICWVYVIVGTTKLKITNISGGNAEDIEHEFKTTFSRFGDADFIDYGFKLLCYPLYKADLDSLNFDGQIKVQNIAATKVVYLNSDGFRAFADKNGLNDVYSIKLSVKPPISFSNNYTQIAVDGEDLVIRGIVQDDGTMAISQGADSSTVPPTASIDRLFASEQKSVSGTNHIYNGMFDIFSDSSSPIYFDLDLTLPQITYSKADVVNKPKNKKFNPKLNSVDFKSLRLTMAGSFFDIDIQKLNKSTMRFSYNEMITTDVSKGILRLFSVDNDNIFNDDYKNSFNGFLFTNDLTLPYSTSAYETFIANNKNAYLSFANQQSQYEQMQQLSRTQRGVTSVVSAGKNIISGAVSGGFSGAISGAVSGLADTINTRIDNEFDKKKTNMTLAYNQTQFDLSIDNMKNAPDTLANANGNALFISSVAEFGIYAELYEGLDTELESANDIMFRDGYSFNRFNENGKTIKSYCHTRKFFNYIQAVLGNIHGVPMSDTMRADLRNRFASGIRFWHQDTIDYSMENYERNLVTE